MAVLYKFAPVHDNLNEGEKKVKGYYPQVVKRGTIHKEEMLDAVSRGSSSLRGELSRAWMLIEDYIVEQLQNGYDVCLNDFGTFSLSAESRLIERKNEIRAESIFVKRLNFRASTVVTKKLKTTRFEREPEHM